MDARFEVAHGLIKADQAKYLIIPIYNQILHLTSNGTLTELTADKVKWNGLSQRMNISTIHKEKKWARGYEKTHIEILLAKKMIEKGGFTSAIFISHPYHLRRIKMITAKVFDETKYKLYFVPSCREKFSKGRWWLSRDDRQWVASEYFKIFWFLLYSYFPYLSST